MAAERMFTVRRHCMRGDLCETDAVEMGMQLPGGSLSAWLRARDTAQKHGRER